MHCRRLQFFSLVSLTLQHHIPWSGTTRETRKQDLPAEVKPLLIKGKLNRKWLLIGCRIYGKGFFNPVPEHSKTGLKAAKIIASAQLEALSLAGLSALIGYGKLQKGLFNPPRERM